MSKKERAFPIREGKFNAAYVGMRLRKKLPAKGRLALNYVFPIRDGADNPSHARLEAEFAVRRHWLSASQAFMLYVFEPVGFTVDSDLLRFGFLRWRKEVIEFVRRSPEPAKCLSGILGGMFERVLRGIELEKGKRRFVNWVKKAFHEGLSCLGCNLLVYDKGWNRWLWLSHMGHAMPDLFQAVLMDGIDMMSAPRLEATI